jgi:uncharacterized phage protein (predicted DNA packaging)
MEQLEEIKEWLRIDGEDEDKTLSSLILAAKAYIKNGTGITTADVENNEDALNLYDLALKMYVAARYENRSGAEENEKGLIAILTQLEIYSYKESNE